MITTFIVAIIFTLILIGLYRFFLYPIVLYIQLGLKLGFQHVGLNYRPLTPISRLNEEGTIKYGNCYGIYLQKVRKNPMIKIMINKIMIGTIMMIFDAQMIKKMNCEYYKHIEKKNLLIFMKQIRKGLVFQEGQQWKQSRTIISNLFHFQMLRSREYLMQDVIKDKIKNLDSGDGMPNLIKLGCSIGGQIVVKSLFGEKYFQIMFGDNNPYQQIRQIIHMIIEETYHIGNVLRIVFLNRTMNKDDYFKTNVQKKILLKLDNFKRVSKQFLMKQKQRFKKGQSISPFIEAYFKQDNSDNYFQQLIHQLFFFLFAGEDTTGSLIQTSLALLSKYPQYQTRILEDVKVTSIHGSKQINNFINQVSRLYSVVDLAFPRIVVKPFVLEGISFHKNQYITFLIGAPMKNAQYWDQPQQFNPDRFNKPLQNPSSFIPFSSGPRNCIGQHMALMQVRIMIIRVLQEYKLQKIGDSLASHSQSVISNLVDNHYVKFVKK